MAATPAGTSVTTGTAAERPTGPPKLPASVLGFGMGGFVDGIVLHQVFQWHHMLTDTGDHPADTVEGLEANTLADGLFHIGTWLFVALGLVLTVNAWQHGRLAPPWRTQLGLLSIGWGVFNVVEGIVNHQLLGLHHVRDDLGGPLSWDLGFLALGALLLVAGLALTRSGARQAGPA